MITFYHDDALVKLLFIILTKHIYDVILTNNYTKEQTQLDESTKNENIHNGCNTFKCLLLEIDRVERKISRFPCENT